MKSIDFGNLAQLVDQYRFELSLASIFAVAALFIVLVVYLLSKLRARAGASRVSDAGRGQPEPRQPAAMPTPIAPEPAEPAAPARPAVAAVQVPLESAKARASCFKLPEESVLRRHYLSNLRYMIETVTFPRPTDSVLRRHYEQLIESRMDDCLKDDAQMEKLVSSYEEYRTNAFRQRNPGFVSD